MSYPQPSSTAPVLAGQGFFRLKTPVSTFASGSGGGCPTDIYESTQGAAAFAIGPESDLAHYKIGYLDPTNSPSLMSIVEITPERMFSGLLYARNEPGTVYQPSGRQGRILIWPTDLWYAGYTPSAAVIPGDTVFTYPPQIDIIQYYSNPPTIQPQRNDKLWFTQYLPMTSGQTTWLVLPSYGRSYIDVEFANATGQAVTYGILGVLYSFGNFATQETTLLMAASVANNASQNKVIKSSTDGVFDALVFSFAIGGSPSANASINFRATMSDTPR